MEDRAEYDQGNGDRWGIITDRLGRTIVQYSRTDAEDVRNAYSRIKLAYEGDMLPRGRFLHYTRLLMYECLDPREVSARDKQDIQMSEKLARSLVKKAS
jgi:hypothetical protein